jgi:hypothetical protein
MSKLSAVTNVNIMVLIDLGFYAVLAIIFQPYYGDKFRYGVWF